MDNSALVPNTQQNSDGRLIDDLKKGGLTFKKKLNNYVHSEHKNIKRPESCAYFMNDLHKTLANYENYIEFNFIYNTVKKFQNGFNDVKKLSYPMFR